MKSKRKRARDFGRKGNAPRKLLFSSESYDIYVLQDCRDGCSIRRYCPSTYPTPPWSICFTLLIFIRYENRVAGSKISMTVRTLALVLIQITSHNDEMRVSE